MIGVLYCVSFATLQYLHNGVDNSQITESCRKTSDHILECKKQSPDSVFENVTDPYGISVNVSTIQNAVTDPFVFDAELPVSYSFLDAQEGGLVSFPINETSLPEACKNDGGFDAVGNLITVDKRIDFSKNGLYNDSVWLVCVKNEYNNHEFSIFQGNTSSGSIIWVQTIRRNLESFPEASEFGFQFERISINKMDAYDNWMMTRIDFVFSGPIKEIVHVLGNLVFLDFFGPINLWYLYLDSFLLFDHYGFAVEYLYNIYYESEPATAFGDWNFPKYVPYSVGTLGITTLYCLYSDLCDVQYFIFSDFITQGKFVLPRQTTELRNLYIEPDTESKWIGSSPPAKSIGIACSTSLPEENGKCFRQVVILPKNDNPSIGMDKYYVFILETDFVSFEDKIITADPDSDTLTQKNAVYYFRQNELDDSRLTNGEGIDFMYGVSSILKGVPYEPTKEGYNQYPVFLRLKDVISAATWIILNPLFDSDGLEVYSEFDMSYIFGIQHNFERVSGVDENLFFGVDPLLEETGFKKCTYDISLQPFYLDYGFRGNYYDFDISMNEILDMRGCTFHLGTAGPFRFDFFKGDDIIIKSSITDVVSDDNSPVKRVQMMTIQNSVNVELVVKSTKSYLFVSNNEQTYQETIEVSENRICLGREINPFSTLAYPGSLFLFYIVNDTESSGYFLNVKEISDTFPFQDFNLNTVFFNEAAFPSSFNLLCNQGEDARKFTAGIFDLNFGFYNVPIEEFEIVPNGNLDEAWNLYVLNSETLFKNNLIKDYQENHLLTYDLVDIQFRISTYRKDEYDYEYFSAALFEDSGNYMFCAFLTYRSNLPLKHHCFDFSPEYRNFIEFDCGHLSISVGQNSNEENFEPQGSLVVFMCNGTNEDGDLTRSWVYVVESDTLHIVDDSNINGPFESKSVTGYDTVFIKTIPNSEGRIIDFDVVGVDNSDPDDIFFSTRFSIETGTFSVFVTSGYEADKDWNKNALSNAIQVTFPVFASLTVYLYKSDDDQYHSPFVSLETRANTFNNSNSPISNFGEPIEFEDLSQFSRFAVEKKITSSFLFVQSNVSPYYQNVSSKYYFPFIDNSNLGTFKFLVQPISSATILLKRGESHETNIFNFFGNQNVLWTLCPDSSDDSIPFFTSASVSSCNSDPIVLDLLDDRSSLQFQKYRMDQTIDPDVMFCYGASSVAIGNACGQHPLIHTSTEDCASRDDPFTCVDGKNEIFSFDTIKKNVTTDCISLAGICPDEAAFSVSTYTGAEYLSISACSNLCIETQGPETCVAFEHSNDECTLYTRNNINTVFTARPCSNGVLAFKCRLPGSDETLSTQVILDPDLGSEPAFFTNIVQGDTVLNTLNHGVIEKSSMEMDRSGVETSFVLKFEQSFRNISGGQIVYICGQDDDVYDENSTDDRVLFTHPSSEEDHFINQSIQECFISTHSLTIHEKETVKSSDPTLLSCLNKADDGFFYTQNYNEQGVFNFYDVKPSHDTSKKLAPQVSIVVQESVNDLNWGKNTQFFVKFSVPPNNELLSVVATHPGFPYAPNEFFYKTYWNKFLVAPTDTAPSDIRPVRLERSEGASSSDTFSAQESDPIDPASSLNSFSIENSSTFDISDVLWGRFLNFKAYIHQNKGSISESEEIEFIHKYIFSMSEVRTASMCPGFDINNTTNTTTDFPDDGCVMTRLSHPVMRPLFSEQVNLKGRQFALGFTTYRVAPFMGVYLDDKGAERMVMPDDDFIKEHGGIGFGAASSVDEIDTETIYSFGGFDYGPDPVYRPFEKLQFTTDPTLQWQPVWHRESQTFGCKDDNAQCTYSDDFYNNVLPQSNLGTVHHKLSTKLHVTGHAHSPNMFWHFWTQRNFQFPSVRDSAKCGPGDVTVDMNRLADYNLNNEYNKISPSSGCGNELKIQVPLTKEKDVDFSSDNSIFPGQHNIYNFFISPTPDDNRLNVVSMLFQYSRKNPEFFKFWPALLNLETFDPTVYTLLPDTASNWAQECRSSRNIVMQEHEGSKGSGRYDYCTPSDSGTTPFLFDDRPENSGNPPWVRNDCDGSKSSSVIQNEYRYVKRSTSNFWSVQFSQGDSQIWNPSAGEWQNTYFTIEGAGGQAFLFNITNTNSDIPFLARECEIGNLALIKMISFFDSNTTEYKKPDVMNQVYSGTGGDFNMSFLYSPSFFSDVFDAIHSTIYLGHNNDWLNTFCREREFSSIKRHFTFYPKNQVSNPSQGNLDVTWPKTASGHKFNFPQKVVDGFKSGEQTFAPNSNGPTCGKEMCLSPFPALLPPFERNCDFYSLFEPPQNSISWRKCPMMPNPDFYKSDQTNDADFFKRQIWRNPAFWSKDSGAWTSKAYRYNINKFVSNPQKINKVFKSIVNGNSANSTVIGNLQCSRSGAVSQQSYADPDLFYVCGGLSNVDILRGCTFCEIFDVKRGKGASIPNIDSSDISTCGSKNIIGLKINQGVVSPNNPFSIQFVVVNFICAPSTTNIPSSPRTKNSEHSYLSIPDSMKEIHYAKSRRQDVTKTVTFNQVILVDESGTMKAVPLYASYFDQKDSYGPGSVCFNPGEAFIFLEYRKNSDKSLIASVEVAGPLVTAKTSAETTIKHLEVNNFACIDANGFTQTNGSVSVGFWSTSKVSPSDYVDIKLDILALNSSEYSFSSLPRGKYFNTGLTYDFSDYRWKTTKGFFQTPEPPIKWACTNSTETPQCGTNVNCSGFGTKCIVRYYDDAPNDIITQVEDNIKNGRNEMFGYITPKETLTCFFGQQFRAFPKNFTRIPDVYGKDACDNQRKQFDNRQMMLQTRSVLERMGQPHFTDIAPRMLIKTAEACSDNTTECHTFHKQGTDLGSAIKMCFHAIGCSKEEYVNVTGEGQEYTCEAFEKCTETVTGKYQNMGTHAGFRPECTLVQACAAPGFYRHHSFFDNNLGQIRLGQCFGKTECGKTSYSSGVSTAVKDATCIEFQNCDFSSQYQNFSGDADEDRQCVELTTCKEGEIVSKDGTRTSDRICVNETIQCKDASQFFDGNSNACKDVTICGVKEIETSANTATSDRVCTQLEECSFYEVEVPGSGLQYECIPRQHASKTEEVGMMAASGSVGLISCLFYIFFS